MTEARKDGKSERKRKRGRLDGIGWLGVWGVEMGMIGRVGRGEGQVRK